MKILPIILSFFLSLAHGGAHAYGYGPRDHRPAELSRDLSCGPVAPPQGWQDTVKVQIVEPLEFNYIDALADKTEPWHFWLALISIVFGIVLAGLPWLWLYRDHQDVLSRIVLKGRISDLQLPANCVRLKDNEVRGGKSDG